MRIPSGVTDQYIYFVAVDPTDLKTRETGLSSFTVRRSRNGGASAAYTTPTVNETDVTNMPGVYELLLDEDMTIDAGDDSQEVCLHITHASMAPVTRVFELYRVKATAGETIGVSSGAVSNVTTTATATNVTTVNGLASGVITATSIAADAIGASELAADAATEIATAVWATATRQLTALDEDVTTLDLDATIRAAVGLASANLDTQLSTIDTVVDAILVDTGTTLDGSITSILADTNELQTDWVNGGRLDLILDARASQTSVDTIDDFLDLELPALTVAVADLPTNAELATALGTADDAVLTAIADLPTNAELTTALGNADDAVLAAIAAIPAAPTAASVAEAVWDEPIAGHVGAGSTGEALNDAGAGGTPPTAVEIADEIVTRTLDANIVQVNNVTVDGVGTEENPWGP